jgi:MFS transporter, DHA3 family, macrolide efflux protein
MRESLRGLRTFGIVWSGQVVSLFGTSMTSFALAIWVWEQTGTATASVLVGVIGGISALLSKFFAGTLVDRWNRQSVMVVSDSISGLATVILLLLSLSGQLQVWHLYLAAAINAWVRTFQYLAYSAAITLIVPKAQYARARGLISLADYASLIGAPLLGGLLLSLFGLNGLLLVDFATFLFAVTMLLLIRIPQPDVQKASQRVALWRDTLSGYQYIFQRRGLLGLLLIAFTFSLVEALGYPLITPLILARTGDEVLLGTIRAAQGVGGVLGGVLLTVWGGTKRRIHAVLIGVALTGLLGDALMGIGQGVLVWVTAAFFLEFFLPIVLGSYQAIWHDRVQPEMQGRVFAARDTIATFGEPISMLMGGVLSDTLLEPAMQRDGALAPLFGGIVGTGPGAGMALLLLTGGILTAVVGLSGYLFRSVRTVETEALLPPKDETI